MAALAALLDALADKVRDAIDGIDWEIQVEPWPVLNATPITVDMWPADPPTDEELAAMGDIEGEKLFTVRARTNTPDSDATRDVVLSLMDVEDEHSVAVALEDDQTLNGLASQVAVIARTGLQPYPTPEGVLGYLGCQWTVLVIDVSS